MMRRGTEAMPARYSFLVAPMVASAISSMRKATEDGKREEQEKRRRGVRPLLPCAPATLR
jgi:hypothetical protein